MIYRRGDMVMVDHPFSDARGSKVRPMLVVQSDVRNQLLNHCVVAMLTTNLSFVGTDPTQVLVDITTPEGAQSGLSATSAIRCGNLFTLHEKFIIRKIGELSAVLMQRVDDGRKLALELK
ncbi:MAG: type II toxin-antitoxin system PemK/MazF family toxin [Planctomycetes bacterium]|nr:type II toxin-antitoxin system PemK/MazF family toxin [Planctomycetota bacterium]